MFAFPRAGLNLSCDVGIQGLFNDLSSATAYVFGTVLM